MTPNPKLKQISRARAIARSLGYFTAARYLALRGFSIQAALWILLRTEC
jgi:hypothetical protein